MTTTDPIADMLTRIRNALMRRHAYVEMPASRMKHRIANILKEQGYIKDLFVIEAKPSDVLHLDLKYVDPKHGVIQGLKRISKPGRRVYKGATDIPRVRGGLGIAIVSTSRGVMTDLDARKHNVGGEILCAVW